MTAAHYLSMIVTGVGSLIFGTLPKTFSLGTGSSCPFTLSLLLCLGSGVLLATSLIHMLTEVQIELKLTAQLYFCAGFLILYTVDEICHYFFKRKEPEIHSLMISGVCDQNKTSGYRCTNEANQNLVFESTPLLKSENVKKNCFDDKDKQQCCSTVRCVEDRAKEQTLNDPSDSCHNDQNHLHCLIDTEKPCFSNPAAKTGLLIALLIHSILEGISIGVQTKVPQVLLLLGAVGLHKIVLSFCLGLELHISGVKSFNFLVVIFIFSIGSPIGILIGMSVSSIDMFNFDPQLQALAAGSLLYVAAFEVLPRERFKWQHRNDRKAAGIFQVIFLLIGFSCITVLHFFIVPLHESIQNLKNSTKVFGL